MFQAKQQIHVTALKFQLASWLYTWKIPPISPTMKLLLTKLPSVQPHPSPMMAKFKLWEAWHSWIKMRLNSWDVRIDIQLNYKQRTVYIRWHSKVCRLSILICFTCFHNISYENIYVAIPQRLHWLLFGVKALYKQMLEYSQFEPQERNKLQWNRNSYIFIQETSFENVVCEMATIVFRPQCVEDK